MSIAEAFFTDSPYANHIYHGWTHMTNHIYSLGLEICISWSEYDFFCAHSLHNGVSNALHAWCICYHELPWCLSHPWYRDPLETSLIFFKSHINLNRFGISAINSGSDFVLFLQCFLFVMHALSSNVNYIKGHQSL